MGAELYGWGRGWPSCPTRNVVTVICGARDLRLPVRLEIAPLVAGLVLDLEAARGRGFRREWSWGYACRAIAGTDLPSNHSQAVAVDLDAPENPHLTAVEHARPHALRKRIGGRWLRTTMPDDVEAIAHRWGFRWGGTYTKPDPMHFECVLSPAQAIARANDLRRLAGRPTPPPVPHQPEEAAPMLTCPVPWITSATPGREAYFRLLDGPIPNSIRVVAKNDAPLAGIPVSRGGKKVPGGPFRAGGKDDHGRVTDEVIFDFHTRTLYDTVGGPEGIWFDMAAGEIVVASVGGGTYVIARP